MQRSPEVEHAWHDHLVLRLRGQRLDDVQLMRFSARFGLLDRVPVRAAGTVITRDPRLDIAPEAREYVTVISNAKIDGKAIGALGNSEARWHTDMSYNEQPPTASVLYAIEVPASGGNTSFANMYLAYESASPRTCARASRASSASPRCEPQQRRATASRV